MLAFVPLSEARTLSMKFVTTATPHSEWSTITLEFDGWHRQRIQEYLYETGHQTIITAVDPFAFSSFAEVITSKLFHVEQGKIRD